MKAELVEWRLLNSKTGEIASDILILQKKPNKQGGKWMRLNQDPMAYLVKQKQIRGETLRVFLMLTAMVDYQNALPNQKQVAQKLGVNQAQVSRAYGQLKGIGFLYKKQDRFYLSPLVCWKGTQKQMQMACHELLENSNKYLLPQSSGIPNP